jgi:ACDE family multidrug resistance protein
MAETKFYRNHNFQLAAGLGLLVMMTVSIIVPAFPKIVEAFGISNQSVGLLISAFTLPGFLFCPVTGIMADRWGRKRLFIPSVFLFGILGGACFFVHDFNTLLVLRVLQGIVAAPLAGLGVTIIGDLFSGHELAEAMGLNNTIMYTGYIVYPLVGGALAGLAWNYPFLFFLLSIPFGIVAIIALDCPEPKSKPSLREYLGGALHYLKSLKVLWLFSASLITYILLFGGYLTYFSILLGDKFQAHPILIGLFISIVGLVTAIASSQVGLLNKRFSPVSLIVGSFILYAVAMVTIPMMSNLWLCLLPAIIFGIAHGVNLPNTFILTSQIPPLEHRAGFMAIQSTMITLGMTVAPLIMGLAFTLTNLNTTFIIAALIALIIPIMGVIIGKKKLQAVNN